MREGIGGKVEGFYFADATHTDPDVPDRAGITPCGERITPAPPHR